MKTYQVDKDGVFLYEQETQSKPHLAVFVKPPKETKGFKAIWETELCNVMETCWGEAGKGSWVLKKDNRKEKLHTSEGEYTIGVDHEGETYNGLGEIPSWLVAEPKPSPFHSPVDGVWVEDTDEKEAADKASERYWRDAEIAKYDWMRNRHADEVFQEIPTTLSESEFASLVAHLQALRDWPVHPSFPNAAERPTTPVFLS